MSDVSSNKPSKSSELTGEMFIYSQVHNESSTWMHEQLTNDNYNSHIIISSSYYISLKNEVLNSLITLILPIV
jgi:hypothetical protein